MTRTGGGSGQGVGTIGDGPDVPTEVAAANAPASVDARLKVRMAGDA